MPASVSGTRTVRVAAPRALAHDRRLRRSVRCFPHVLAVAAIASVSGCPTQPPSLPGPGLGTGGDATTDSTGATGDDATSAMESDTEGPGSEGSSTTGAGIDDTTGEGDDDGEPITGCGASPTMCTMPSSYDGGGACDPFQQDCPAGEKCMPVATVPSGTWDSTACRPIAANAAQLGDTCAVRGEATSGMDDCGLGLMCWNVRGGRGTCVALCECGPMAPSCPAPGLTCTVANGGNLPLCLPPCDPILQDCPAGEGCYPQSQSVGFVCAADASGTEGTTPGDPCEFVNACSPGQVCAGPTNVAGCDPAAVGCCAAICDQSDPAPCSAPSARCVSWWGAEEPPEGCPAGLGICDAI
jgi:hypothetical protein